jgi:hypothetical protein
LQTGRIKRYKQVNLAYKKLIKNTSKELAEYFDNFINYAVIYNMDDVRSDFINENRINNIRTPDPHR